MDRSKYDEMTNLFAINSAFLQAAHIDGHDFFYNNPSSEQKWMRESAMS